MYTVLDLLTVDDILYAAILAFFLTWIITTISKAFNIAVSFPVEFDYNSKDLNKLLQKCYVLFPKDIVLFHGKTFKRGMHVRITTTQKKTFEGRLIGINSDNMLCLLTSRNLVAQQIDNIADIITLER